MIFVHLKSSSEIFMFLPFEAVLFCSEKATADFIFQILLHFEHYQIFINDSRTEKKYLPICGEIQIREIGQDILNLSKIVDIIFRYQVYLKYATVLQNENVEKI